MRAIPGEQKKKTRDAQLYGIQTIKRISLRKKKEEEEERKKRQENATSKETDSNSIYTGWNV